MKTNGTRKALLALYHYFCFFLLMAFFITCCMLLFINTMMRQMGLTLTEENIRTAAVVTFGNVVFLSLVCTLIDGLRRKLTVERPVRQIVAAAGEIAKGNYSVRLPEMSSINRADGLDEVAECFNMMAKELAGTETLQTDFIANVSHELKTPLTVIQNYATMLQKPDLNDRERMEYSQNITASCRRLANLISNILKLNKLENQQIFPTRQVFDLNSQLCECLLGFEDAWTEKDIQIETDLDEDILVEIDPELLTLVWNNLFSNAIKFTDNGGTVSVTLKAEGPLAVVSVADTGCGISAEVGKHIFEKFYQGDTSHSTQGNGLGLALVRRVVDIVGGDITVESEVGSGSRFTVSLRRVEHG